MMKNYKTVNNIIKEKGMARAYMIRILLLCFSVFFLIACESEADKTARLMRENLAKIAEEVKKEEHKKADLQKQLYESVKVTLTENKTSRDEDFYKRHPGAAIEARKHLLVALIENKSGKDISGVLGTIALIDTFDAPIHKLGVKIEKTIKSGGSTKLFYQWQSMESLLGDGFPKKDVLISEGKFKYKYDPEMVVFSDSTKLVSEKKSRPR